REIVLDIERCIDEAFERNEFFVVFQPKISLADGKVKGAEALVRWNSSLHGFVNPSVFIPVFEQNGYVTRLDFFVYQKVFEYQQEQIQQGRPVVPISVNVSRLHQNPEKFVSAFTSKFNQYSLTPDCVELELVERFAGASDKILIQLTELLRGAGFKVNMDDFGSGESSLNMLSEIPVDVIKFDQRFLRQAQTSKDSLIILSETMNMVRKLGKLTVCEGVETEGQVEMLRSMDCDLVQGFFYSKPLSKDAFTGYVARNI
ncbi:MAG: EAL domain-containing protein, partial [Treponema sp.]|nr:EAL domain-containing protein [Treponema sp.]